ncbi:hypothetical protein niasHT_032461 [Heterodera trifolii]|uniref:Ornithine decarboxylase n=1 Tax=Heterodera trifolii TaxID=157864 RepID=A0ABD2ILM2_9BILA
MVHISQTCQTPRNGLFAGKNVSIFEDIVFDQGLMAASQRIAQHFALERNAIGHDDAFSVIILDRIVEQFLRWRLMLPTRFDCASRGEIESIVKNGLCSGDNIVYANPCKTKSYIRHAEQMGIRRMTFDSVEELLKIKEMHSSAQLILRIAVADPTAQCPLATKFGCDLDAAPALLQLARDQGMELIGISFHVGSGCRDPSAFREAISASKKLFVLGTSMGHRMQLLDIGGGFPGHDTAQITFEQVVHVIQMALDDYFPLNDNAQNDFVEIIAEPGRFFGSSPVSLCPNVIAVQRVPSSRVTKTNENAQQDGFMLYINDGVYGSFNCILFDHFQPRGRPLFDVQKCHSSDSKNCDGQMSQFPTIVWGQTCDGLDQVEAQTVMRQMNVGEWLFYENMGAYTSVAASNFNGFNTPNSFYAVSESTWKEIKQQRQII